VAAGRRSTVRNVRASAPEFSKSFELEQRLGRVEVQLKDVVATIDALNKRTIAMQAQLDHLTARLTRQL